MSEQDLDMRFQKAVDIAETMTQADLPQDVQLRLYAYYKQATSGMPSATFNANFDLRNAFKTNAWMQVSHLSTDEAKELYIELINSVAKK
ncbi:MAG: phosphatidylserine decarboxylase [Flavobacterium sp.]|nr:MAG: phosphatidylserine decarboxylase [Flavobacterium sp.]